MYQSSGPRVAGATGPSTATVSIQAPELAPGRWEASLPSELGPFPRGGAPPSTVHVRVVAHGQPFDRTVISSTGDPWLSPQAAYTPISLWPGEEGQIQVHITPRGAPGTVARGVLYLLSRNHTTNSNDELLAIPYTYTIGSK